MVNLPVKFKSQWDSDASLSANDCGPCSVAQVLNYYGENLTTNEVGVQDEAGAGLVTVEQLLKSIAHFGYEGQYIPSATPEILKSYLDRGIPVVPLVHYGSLISTQDKHFIGGHFFVAVGYRDDGYFVNDPNFRDQFRQDGDHHFYTKAEFEKAWSDCHLDKNPDRSFIVILPKTVSASSATGIVTPGQGNVNIRNSPHLTGAVLYSAPQGTRLPLEGHIPGDSVLGNNVWYKIQSKQEYVWSGRIEVQAASSTLVPPTTPTPDPSKEDIARAGIVIHDALSTLKDANGAPFGNAEGLARALVASYPTVVQVETVKKDPNTSTFLDKLAKILGLTK